MYYYNYLFIFNNLEENRKKIDSWRGISGAADQRGQRFHTGPHFSALAQPSDNPMYDQKFYRLCGLDYDVMKRIASNI